MANSQTTTTAKVRKAQRGRPRKNNRNGSCTTTVEFEPRVRSKLSESAPIFGTLANLCNAALFQFLTKTEDEQLAAIRRFHAFKADPSAKL